MLCHKFKLCRSNRSLRLPRSPCLTRCFTENSANLFSQLYPHKIALILTTLKHLKSSVISGDTLSSLSKLPLRMGGFSQCTDSQDTLDYPQELMSMVPFQSSSNTECTQMQLLLLHYLSGNLGSSNFSTQVMTSGLEITEEHVTPIQESELLVKRQRPENIGNGLPKILLSMMYDPR